MVITVSYYLTSLQEIVIWLHYCITFKKYCGSTMVQWRLYNCPLVYHGAEYYHGDYIALVLTNNFVSTMVLLCHILHSLSTALNPFISSPYCPVSVHFQLTACFSLNLFFSLFFSHPLIAAGEELLGNEGARYLKMDDLKDHDEDFLSPKNVLEYEGELQWWCWRLFRFNKKRHMYKEEGS